MPALPDSRKVFNTFPYNDDYIVVYGYLPNLGGHLAVWKQGINDPEDISILWNKAIAPDTHTNMKQFASELVTLITKREHIVEEFINQHTTTPVTGARVLTS